MLILSLVLAWVAVSVRYLRLPGISAVISSDEHLVKAHIDYLLMTLLLYAFALLGITLPMPIQGCMVVGAFTNPLLFIVLAINPGISRAMLTPLGIFATLSFSVTTLGFGGAAILVILAML